MAVSGLNILYTTVHFPYPPIGGDRIKQLNIIKYLARNNKVFLVSLDRGYEYRESFLEEMRKMNVEPYCFHINPLKAYLSAAIMSPSGKPMEINYFRHKEFRQKVNEILANNKIDLAIGYYLRTTDYIKNLDIKKILVSDDCRTFYQYRTYKESTNLVQRAIRLFEWNKLKKFESRIVDYFDVTTYVTERDLSEMRKLNSNADLRILSNGVDTELFIPPADSAERRDMVFTGKLNVWVNNLMIKKIAEEILPGIKKAVPGVKLHLVGSNPTKEILKYVQDNSVIIHSDVPSMVPFLQQAAVFIHPHIGGSGIQNKLLEAMSCGCPVVTTESGAWGFNINQGVNGFVAKDNSEFIRLSVELLNNPGLVRSVGQNARQYIEDNHKWDYIFDSLEMILADVME